MYMLSKSQTKMGIAAHLCIDDPYFKTFFFVLKWVKAEINYPILFLSCYIFTTIVATPGRSLSGATVLAEM
jgi:hypothetical protein